MQILQQFENIKLEWPRSVVTFTIPTHTLWETSERVATIHYTQSEYFPDSISYKQYDVSAVGAAAR